MLDLTSGLNYKFFMIVIYDHKGTLQFATYLVILIYDPGCLGYANLALAFARIVRYATN
jgi:hypothetical protein